MPKSPEQFRPLPEEIKHAEETMTDEQRKASEEREASFLQGMKDAKRHVDQERDLGKIEETMTDEQKKASEERERTLGAGFVKGIDTENRETLDEVNEKFKSIQANISNFLREHNINPDDRNIPGAIDRMYGFFKQGDISYSYYKKLKSGEDITDNEYKEYAKAFEGFKFLEDLGELIHSEIKNNFDIDLNGYGASYYRRCVFHDSYWTLSEYMGNIKQEIIEQLAQKRKLVGGKYRTIKRQRDLGVHESPKYIDKILDAMK